MANEYELAIDIEAPADAAWAIIGDPTGVPKWFPKYVQCTLDGDIRTLTNADGGVLVEKILDRDDEARQYSYTVIEGPPLKSHWASFEVRSRGEACSVLWHTRAEFVDPAIDTEARLAGAQREGLERLKSLCEGTG